MKKLTLLVAAGAGYVLGSRAGRERYEQIKTQATKTWNSPTVQDAVDEVQTHAKQAGADLADTAGSKIAEAAGASRTRSPTRCRRTTPATSSRRRSRRGRGRRERRPHPRRRGVHRPADDAGDGGHLDADPRRAGRWRSRTSPTTGKKVGVGAGLFGLAGTLALYGLGALIATAILGIAEGLEPWIAAGIVTVVLFAAAGVAALVGKGSISTAGDAAAARVESVKADIDTAKHGTDEGDVR